METMPLIGLITALGPFIMVPLKRILGTHKIQDDEIKGTVNEALVLVLGLIASILNEFLSEPVPNWRKAVIVGLAGGAGAGFVRNTDKNITGIATALLDKINPNAVALQDKETKSQEDKK